MEREELLKLLESVKAPEPNEETVLQSEERLIRELRNSFPKIIQERRVIRMKRKILAVVSIAIVAVILSVVVVPTIKVANAKKIAKEVIAKEMHATVNDEDMTVEGNIVKAVAVIVDEKGVTIGEITVDMKERKIIKISMAESISLTEEEKNRAIEIFKNSPEAKKFPITAVVPPENENIDNENGIIRREVRLEDVKYVDISKGTIVSVKGYSFSDRNGKYAIVEVQSDLLPKGDVVMFVVDLQKGCVVSIYVVGRIITGSSVHP